MLELIGIDELTQWDVGRQIKVDKDIDMVHFSNRPYGYSKNVKVTAGVADVPDMFLTSCAPLRVWAYVGDFEKGYTKIEKTYEIKPKNRPEDYIYTPEEIKTWEKLQSEIGDLANLETKAKENLVAAINEAAKSGSAEDAVLYTEQNLTNAQREQARANINAVGNEAIEFFNSEFKTHSEICKAYESGKVCYYPYAVTKLMSNSYSGRMQPFVFSGTNGSNEFLTVTVNTDNSVVQGDRGIYNLTEVPQATAETIGGVKADSVEAADTQPVRIGGDGKLYTAASGTDISLGLTSAAVGQIIKVKAIDESGKPTAWEAADMPSGGGGAYYRSWSKVWTLVVAEDIAGFEASNINLDGKSEIMIVFISDSTASRTMTNGRIYINGVDAGKMLFNTLPLRKDSHSFVIIGRADDGIEYTTMAATAEYQSYPWQGEVKVVHRMVSGVNKDIQWIAGSTIKITQSSATLGKGVTIEIYVR